MKKIISVIAVLALLFILPVVFADETTTSDDTTVLSVDDADTQTISSAEEKLKYRLEAARAEYKKKIESSKEGAKTRREALKAEYELSIKAFKAKHDELKMLKKKYDSAATEKKDELKTKLRKNAFDALYERLKASMKKLETLEEKEIISAEDSETIRAKMTSIKTRLGAEEFTKEELISISKELNSLFKDISVSGKKHAATALINKIEAHIKTAKIAAEKVQKAIDRMKEKGLDTSKAEESLALFNEQITSAETAFESAITSVEAAKTKEEKHEALKAAFEDFKETAKELKDAFHSLKQAIREVLSEAKGSDDSEDETEDKSNDEAKGDDEESE